LSKDSLTSNFDGMPKRRRPYLFNISALWSLVKRKMKGETKNDRLNRIGKPI